MSADVSYPADCVVNGATAIQATIFNAVAADYIEASANTLYQFRKRNGDVNGLPQMAQNGALPLGWVFYLRKDMTTDVFFRNLIGIKVTSGTQARTSNAPELGRDISTRVQVYRVESHNWYPVKFELSNDAEPVFWMEDVIIKSIVQNPEGGDIEATAELSTNPLYEALGFILKQTAAAYPALGPALNAISGLNPLG